MSNSRLVFGGAPTIQEAMQATSELNDALHQMTYLSPNNTQRLEDSENMEIQPCLVTETAVTRSVPNSTMETFRFLQETPAAKKVVASLVSDPIVWDAFTQNEEFNNFVREYQQTSSALPDADPNLNDSFVCNKIPSPEATRNSEECGKGFMERMVEVIIKQLSVDMEKLMKGLLEHFLILFGGPAGNGNGTSAESWISWVSKLMEIVIMVIMAIVLKRPF